MNLEEIFIALQNPTDGLLAVGVENLVEVVQHVVRGGRGIAHHKIIGLHAGNLRDHLLIDVAIKAGYQVVVIDRIDLLAVNLALLDAARQG